MHTHHNKNASSSNSSEPQPATRAASHVRRLIIDIPTSSSDDEVLNSVKSRLHKYPIGTGVRREFDDGWFDDERIKMFTHDKLWKVKYTDGDMEDLNEDQLIRFSSQFNQKYNVK